MSNKKNKLQGYDTLVSTFVLLSKESKEEGLNPCCSGRWSRTSTPLK